MCRDKIVIKELRGVMLPPEELIGFDDFVYGLCTILLLYLIFFIFLFCFSWFFEFKSGHPLHPTSTTSGTHVYMYYQLNCQNKQGSTFFLLKGYFTHNSCVPKFCHWQPTWVLHIVKYKQKYPWEKVSLKYVEFKSVEYLYGLNINLK